MHTPTQINHAEVKAAFIQYYHALAKKSEKWPSMVAHDRFMSQCEARLDAVEAKVQKLEQFKF